MGLFNGKGCRMQPWEKMDEWEKSLWEKDSRRMRWVDLGLSSGNLWGTFDFMSHYYPETMGPLCFRNGAFTSMEADDIFRKEYRFNYKYFQTSYQRYAISGPVYGEYEVDIPTLDDYKELINRCRWEFSRFESGRVDIVGKSKGNQIKFCASEKKFFDGYIGGWTTYNSRYAFCLYKEYYPAGLFRAGEWRSHIGMKENVNNVSCPVRLILRRRYQ